MRCVACDNPNVVPAYGRMVKKLPDGSKVTLCQKCSSARGAKKMKERMANGTWGGRNKRV